MKRIKLTRTAWQRKPQTQVVPNKKALKKKYGCRKAKGSTNNEAD
ncbi:hypothetical protein DCCM_0199 [Desulfocucumis palustris]|uniref:Uncharacterized protein n=1 Tax=Desulfocucumis palustris TaxID=1898651 RepID=A0A2L2X7F3_9FIRM|nr:hypothetical protein [Desulfocucumis palustris]GBF32008.1 hypothetical protein DCCM_0199 [Desulfocucumis palustris]